LPARILLTGAWREQQRLAPTAGKDACPTLVYGFFGAGAGLLFAFGAVRCGTGGADLCGAEPAAGRCCWAG